MLGKAHHSNRAERLHQSHSREILSFAQAADAEVRELGKIRLRGSTCSGSWPHTQE